MIPGWSRPAAVISLELSEVTACASGETETKASEKRKSDKLWPRVRLWSCLARIKELKQQQQKIYGENKTAKVADNRFLIRTFDKEKALN